MKKLSIKLLPVVALIVATGAFADKGKTPRFSWGVHGGLNMGNASASPAANAGAYYQGLMGGTMLEFGMGSHFSLPLEFNYVQDGANVNSPTRRLELVQIPLTIKFAFGSSFRPWFAVGGYVSYLLNATINGAPALGSFNRVDYGLAGQAGFDIWLGKRVAFYVSGMFSYGLTDLELGTNTYNTMSIQGRGGLKIGF